MPTIYYYGLEKRDIPYGNDAVKLDNSTTGQHKTKNLERNDNHKEHKR